MKEINRIKGLSVLQMFERNSFQYGFWFDSWRWASTCCRVLYFEYNGKKLPEHKPLFLWDRNQREVKVFCEFWNRKTRKLIKTDYIHAAWRDDVFEMWKIK